MRNQTSNFFYLGGILVFVGMLLILETFGFVGKIHRFWPLLPLIIGIGLLMIFFKDYKRDYGFLALGIIITTNSMLFLYLSLTGYSKLSFLWPIFLIFFGIMFGVMGYYSNRKLYTYLAIFFVLIGILFFAVFSISYRLWPLSFIIIGMSLVLISYIDKK